MGKDGYPLGGGRGAALAELCPQAALKVQRQGLGSPLLKGPGVFLGESPGRKAATKMG